MPLFQVAVVEHPSKKDAEENGASEKLILAPKAVVARDSQGAAIKALRDLDQSTIDLDKCEVMVVPFK